MMKKYRFEARCGATGIVEAYNIVNAIEKIQVNYEITRITLII